MRLVLVWTAVAVAVVQAAVLSRSCIADRHVGLIGPCTDRLHGLAAGAERAAGDGSGAAAQGTQSAEAALMSAVFAGVHTSRTTLAEVLLKQIRQPYPDEKIATYRSVLQQVISRSSLPCCEASLAGSSCCYGLMRSRLKA